MKYGYARVSTVGQDMDAQLAALQSEGCEMIFSEKFTGTKVNRPQFHLVPCLVPQFLKLEITRKHQESRNLDISIIWGTSRY